VKTLTFVFGRFQPPTKGHARLLVAARQFAGDGELRVYPSRTQDAKKNPLTPEQKHHFLQQAFPSMASCFVDDERVRTALDVLTLASEEGFQKAVMVVGVMGYAGEMELKSLKKRTAEGRAVDKSRGVKFGRKKTYTEHQEAEVLKKRSEGEGYGTIARSLGMSRSMVQRIVKDQEAVA